MHVQAILDDKGTTVATIRPNAPLTQAIERFRNEGIGALVVTDTAGGILGVLAERDVVHGLAEQGGDVLQQTVEAVMHRRPATCAAEDDIREAMQTMTRRRLRHLPVLADGQLAGIISIGDVVKNRLDEMTLEMNVLRDAYIASH
ncbi:MAG: CBS domain-containing protein [Alphaproteobacteria bacterium]|jgi:CBS domain-containing protein|nr:CBS domain-containing protein [Alphaproteobacteria bacterium]MDP6566575.1 CBS domain-containing protein [Alphaproteobacteria bacterium]MDP6813643.1 CBS domain-containing protein [Alphaproteobacteria bacterium]